MISLRPYQLQAVADVNAAYASGSRRVLLVCATGSGKSTMGAELCRGRGRVLWLAHRAELLAQAEERMRAMGVHGAQVLTIQSLLTRPLPPHDFLVIDEGHHAVSDNKWTAFAAGLTTPVLGLTATPMRADGIGLGGTFDTLVTGPSAAELVAQGHLCPVDVFAPAEVQGGFAMAPRAAWERFGGGRRTVVFCRTVAEAESEREAWGSGEVIHGKLSATERARRLATSWRVMMNVFIATEGFDMPEVKCVILARGCGSLSTYLQIVGRALRPHESYATAVVIDLTGASRAHGHPLDPREYSLTGPGVRSPAASSHAFCAACSALIPDATEACPRCGHKRESALRRASRIEAARLERVERNANSTDSVRQQALTQWAVVGRARGYSPGWASQRYKAAYHTWPTVEQLQRARGAR